VGRGGQATMVATAVRVGAVGAVVPAAPVRCRCSSTGSPRAAGRCSAP
jgi:hypothetical protein